MYCERNWKCFAYLPDKTCAIYDRLTEVNYNEINHLGNSNGDRVRLIEVTVEQRSNLQLMWEATFGKLKGDRFIEV